jgi:CubicO group peptidase (beta-lactamase class C family)
MNFRNFLSSVAAMVILASIATAQIGGGPGGVATPSITFNKQAFDQTMNVNLDGNVMGWQYVLIKKGQVVSEDAGGLAQNAADGNIPMTVNTPSNIGSVSKFLSGTAMLGLMQKPQTISQYDNGLTLNQKLNRKIATVMPNAWTNNMMFGVSNISFRQMLSHRTGFDTDKASNRNVLGYLKDADGFLLSQFDDREYANINYVLNGYLLNAYTTTSFKQSWNNAQSMYGWTDEQTDAMYRQAMGAGMHNLMKTRIWDKMTPKIYPNCDAANTLQNVAAYGYTSANDNAAGQITSSIDTQGHCGGHGGYYLSGRGLANYLAHFAATDLIVNQEARDLMHTDNMAPEDKLVWSFNRSSQYFGDNFGMPNVSWTNGVAGGWRTVVIKFPLDYYLVMITNSPDISADGLRGIGFQAFRDATEHNFD